MRSSNVGSDSGRNLILPFVCGRLAGSVSGTLLTGAAELLNSGPRKDIVVGADVIKAT